MTDRRTDRQNCDGQDALKAVSAFASNKTKKIDNEEWGLQTISMRGKNYKDSQSGCSLNCVAYNIARDHESLIIWRLLTKLTFVYICDKFGHLPVLFQQLCIFSTARMRRLQLQIRAAIIYCRRLTLNPSLIDPKRLQVQLVYLSLIHISEPTRPY